MKLLQNILWLPYLLILMNDTCSVQQKLLISTHTSHLKEIDLNTGVVTELATINARVESLAYDYKENYLYVPRYYNRDILRFKYPNNQSAILQLVARASSKIIGVAFDSTNSHLYWTENGGNIGRIMRCNSDGSDIKHILTESQPSVLTLNIANRFLYYGQTQGIGKLNRITVDGKHKITLINHTSRVYGIGLDHTEKRIYWMEFTTGELKSAWLDGSDVKPIVRTNVVSLNWNIAISNDFIFYSSNNTIWKIKKSLGQIPTIVHTDTERILGVLFHTNNAAYIQHVNKQEQHKIHNHGVRFIHDVNMDNSRRNTAAHLEQSDAKLV